MLVGSTVTQGLRHLFAKHLLLTNTCVCTSLLGVGDGLQQLIGIHINKNGRPYDWLRTARTATVGLALGPMNHAWYFWLDGVFPGAKAKTVMKKIALDQMSCPAFSSVFITGICMLEGKTFGESVDEYKQKFFHILLLDWALWPPTQMLNFWLLPPQYRVVYISTVQLFYNTVMCYIKHQYGLNDELPWTAELPAHDQEPR